MKKLLVLIPAIGISLMACQKEEAKAPTKNKGIDLKTIQGQIATNHWAPLEGDCFPGGSDCLDEVTCTPSFWDYFWDTYFKYRQAQDEAVRSFATVERESFSEPNNQNDELRVIIGDQTFEKVLSGEYLLKVRLNANNENLFLAIYDASEPDIIRLVIPLAKP